MSVLAAADLLTVEGSGFLTRSILSFVAFLDSYGAQTWNLRLVGLWTAAGLFLVKKTFGKRGGVDWYALLHAILSASGSLACFYLDFFESERLTGMAEPFRSCKCYGAMTSLHRLVPAITMGYSLLDLMDGLTIGLDFAAHGAATLVIMAYFCELELAHIINSMLLMEVSTPFLTIVRAEFFTPLTSALNQACFVLTFFFFRILLVPYVWFVLMSTMVQHGRECFPKYFTGICIGFGIFFHGLNAFWFYKLVKKVRRKILGIEKVHSNNELEGTRINGTIVYKANGHAKKV